MSVFIATTEGLSNFRLGMYLPVDKTSDALSGLTQLSWEGVAEALQNPEAGHTATTKRATHSAFISASQIPSYSL